MFWQFLDAANLYFSNDLLLAGLMFEDELLKLQGCSSLSFDFFQKVQPRQESASCLKRPATTPLIGPGSDEKLVSRIPGMTFRAELWDS